MILRPLPNWVTPYQEMHHHPASINLTVGTVLMESIDAHVRRSPQDPPVIDIPAKMGLELQELPKAERYSIPPGKSVLIRTAESLEVPDNAAAVIYGIASMTQPGQILDGGAFARPGWKGSLLLRLTNVNHVHAYHLHHGAAFCQVVFHSVSNNYQCGEEKW